MELLYLGIFMVAFDELQEDELDKFRQNRKNK
jgi:hypothetical protein